MIPRWVANELEIAILNLFVDIRVRYPNLIVGKLERDTVKRAMEEGITASQVSAVRDIERFEAEMWWRIDYQLLVDACTSADAEECEWALNAVVVILIPSP